MSGIDSVRLKAKKELILSLWEERCLKEVLSAGTATPLALRNSLPLYLDHLSEALATNRKMDFKSILNHDEESNRIGKLHGADRAGNRSYALTEMILEYHILREVIFHVLENEGPLASLQRDIILDSIEQAVNDAAVKFSEVHADIQQKFINTLTHDLKNPLSAAMTYAEIIRQSTDKPEVCRNSASRIIINLRRLDAMIRDLLDASRVRAGEQLSLQFIDGNLDALLREVVDEMTVIHGDRFVVDSKVAVEGNWGCDGLRRAIENLLGNAVKYSTPETPITISLRRVATSVELIVHNQGPPILEAEIPYLFQQYRRSKAAHEGTQPGWGLGLTLVKGVVDAHKGTIHVESKAGTGTRFIIMIPFPVPPPTE